VRHDGIGRDRSPALLLPTALRLRPWQRFALRLTQTCSAAPDQAVELGVHLRESAGRHVRHDCIGRFRSAALGLLDGRRLLLLLLAGTAGARFGAPRLLGLLSAFRRGPLLFGCASSLRRLKLVGEQRIQAGVGCGTHRRADRIGRLRASAL